MTDTNTSPLTRHELEQKQKLNALCTKAQLLNANTISIALHSVAPHNPNTLPNTLHATFTHAITGSRQAGSSDRQINITTLPSHTAPQTPELQQHDLILLLTDGDGNHNTTHNANLQHAIQQAAKPCFMVQIHRQTQSQTETETTANPTPDSTTIPVLSVNLHNGTLNHTDTNALQTAIHHALPDDKKQLWSRAAKACSPETLSNKKAAWRHYIAHAAATAARYTTTTIAESNIRINLGAVLDILNELQTSYGLDHQRLSQLHTNPDSSAEIKTLAQRLLYHHTAEGAYALLQEFDGSRTFVTATQHLPMGQVISAGFGYALTLSACEAYLNDCSKLATLVM